MNIVKSRKICVTARLNSFPSFVSIQLNSVINTPTTHSSMTYNYQPVDSFHSKQPSYPQEDGSTDYTEPPPPFGHTSTSHQNPSSLPDDMECLVEASPEKERECPESCGKIFFTSFVSAALFVASLFMLSQEGTMLQLFGILIINFSIYFLLISSAMMFNAVEILGEEKFLNRCIGGCFITIMILLFWIVMKASSNIS